MRPATQTVTVGQQGLSTIVKNQEDVTSHLLTDTSALFVSKMVLFKIQTPFFSGCVSTNPGTRLQDEDKRIQGRPCPRNMEDVQAVSEEWNALFQTIRNQHTLDR